MPQPQTQPRKPKYFGEQVVFEWRAPEYRNLKKARPYTRVALALVGLLLVWALYFSNYLFAFSLLIIGVVCWVLGAGHTLKLHQFAITDSGLWVDNDLKAFIDLRYFSVVPFMTRHDRFLVFRQNKGGQFRVPVPIEEAERIRLVVNQYVPQKEYAGGAFDSFDRLFW